MPTIISILGYPNTLTLLISIYPTVLNTLNITAIFKYSLAKINTSPLAPSIFNNGF